MAAATRYPIYPTMTKYTAAASIINLNTDGLSDEAIQYLAFAFDTARDAYSDARGNTQRERVESATVSLMKRLAGLDEHMGGEKIATAAGDEIHARTNDAQADGRGLDVRHRAYYVLAIAGRMIFAAAKQPR